MMIRNRKLLKTLSVFFIIEILFNSVTPAISYALTSGPTAPEATSFEPFDTSDMVNVGSGDFIYNLPLLEVPGPSGSYPLSLSYHGGIQPNEEASWVGLGWTLNPGSLTRNVNGYADDHVDRRNFSRHFWEGGETRTYSIGVSIGLAGTPASVSAGLSFSQDTYQGFGVGWNVGVGMQLGNSPFSVGVSVGVSPYGQSYASAGLNLSVPIGGQTSGVSGSVGVGVTISGDDVGYSASVGINARYGSGEKSGSVGLLGASISTNGKGASANLSVVGASYQNNSSSAYVRSNSHGFSIPIPVYYGISITLGYNYNRYWIDNLDFFGINGALYYPTNTTELLKADLDEKAYDTYSLLDPTLEGVIVSYPDPDKVVGGSFPSFDNYAVQAQGLYGTMRPFMYQRHLYKRNNYKINSDGNREYSTIQYDMSRNNSGERNYRAEFRFLNDFSNRFEYTPADITWGTNAAPLTYSFNSGAGLKSGEQATSTYTDNKVQGSRNIEWFTNKEIYDKNARVTSNGLVETVSTGFQRYDPYAGRRGDPDGTNIGAFLITNESGVKYHFALPAYSYLEYMYSGKKTGAETYNDLNKPAKYAYTWYLTGITGPDYVDRGPTGPGDGKLNDYDWGYWVEFEYGKWTQDYAWRNPSEGTISDIDSDFENYSEGIKELWYLDAIRTKTHTALFIKDIRHDAKSTVFYERNIDARDNHYVVKADAKSKIGGFTPAKSTCICDRHSSAPTTRGGGWDKGSLSYTTLPASSMKLTSIIITENKNAVISKAQGSAYAQSVTASWVPEIDMENKLCDFSTHHIDYHLYGNVIDVHDLAAAPSLVSKAIRKIDFDTDYSLTPGTSNSFDQNLVKVANPSTLSSSYPKFGKLTLKKLITSGKGGAGNLIPPIKFTYDIPERYQSVFISQTNGVYNFGLQNSSFVKGDLLKIRAGSTNYYAVIQSIAGTTHNLKVIGGTLPSLTTSVFVTKTKNPAYNKNAYDIWGLYKSDFVEGVDEAIGRLVTENSAKSLDVWSLRSIQTPTGARLDISYEPDTYSKPVLNNSNDFIIKKGVRISGTVAEFTLESTFAEIGDAVFPGSEIGYSLLFADPYKYISPPGQTCGSSSTQYYTNIQEGTITVKDIFQRNGEWVISTETNLDNVFRILPTQTFGVNNECKKQYSSSFFVGGNFSFGGYAIRYGGGIRVKELAMSDSRKTSITRYKYENPSFSGQTSGVTSYEPNALNRVILYYPTDSSFPKSLFEKTYKKSYYRGFEKIFLNSREIPPPGVLYQFVTLSQSTLVNGVDRSTGHKAIHEFEVFKEGLVDVTLGTLRASDFAQQNYNDYVKYSRKETRNVVVKDFSSRVGSLRAVTLLDADGVKISETRNEYLHDEYPTMPEYESALNTRFNNQGVLEETFTDSRFASRSNNDFVLQGVISKHEQFPLIQTGQTTINYRDNVTTSSQNVAFDYYSGVATKAKAIDAYGNVFLTETTPAYRIYSSMGQAALGGKNMLAQSAGSVTYLVNPSNTSERLGIMSASVQTWTDQTLALSSASYTSAQSQPGIWRKGSTYTFVGLPMQKLTSNGLYPVDGFAAFNFASGSSNPLWQEQTAITLSDVLSHALEARDLNGIYSASRPDNALNRIVATVKNGAYKEFNYTGFEGVASGATPAAIDWMTFGGTASTEAAHTGTTSVKTTASGNGGFSLTIPANAGIRPGKYLISVWVKASNSAHPKLAVTPCTGGATQFVGVDATKKNGTWYLIERVVDFSNSCAITVSGHNSATSVLYWDDIRILPLEGSMTAYVYNEWGELAFTLDNRNMYTRFSYDAMGRLTTTYKETFTNAEVKVSETKYNYANR